MNKQMVDTAARWVVCVGVIIFALTVSKTLDSVQAQTTEFAYQGQLQNAGSPANGNFDFEFMLFDSLAGGAQNGGTLTKSTVPVAGGVFSVKLDFGANYPGANRFMEIHVRQTGGGGFVPSTPRQAINSNPY